MNAPQTAAQAAEQLHELHRTLDDRRRKAAHLANAQADAEALYKGQRWRALAAGVPGRNADQREAHVMTLELRPDVRTEAAEIAGRVGIAGWTPETLDDLRWLRDRAEGIAEAASAAAYDTRDVMRAWTSVSSWAKAEYEQVMSGPRDSRVA